jgi:hypothetical protein
MIEAGKKGTDRYVHREAFRMGKVFCWGHSSEVPFSATYFSSHLYELARTEFGCGGNLLNIRRTSKVRHRRSA